MSEPTRVTAGLHYTINLGNYETIKIDAVIEDYVREVDEGSAKKAYNRVFKLVESLIDEKAVALEKELKNG